VEPTPIQHATRTPDSPDANTGEGSLAIETKCEALMDFARDAMFRGDLQSAVKEISLARDLAERSSSTELKVTAASRYGIILSRAGKAELAINAINNAQAICEGLNEKDPLRVKVSVNKAALLLDAGFYKQSNTELLALATTFKNSEDPHARGEYLVAVANLVYLSLLTDQTRGAIRWGEQFERFDREKPNTLDFDSRFRFECWYASALARSGAHEQAAERLSILRARLPSSNFNIATQFEISLSVSEAYAGNAQSGIARLEQLASDPQKLGVVYAQVLHALTLVYEHTEDIASALECIEKLEQVMKNSARGIVGIDERSAEERRLEELELERRNAKRAAKNKRNNPDDDDDDPDLLDDPRSSSIDLLDDRAAQLRIRRFMELAHDERRTVLDSIARASSLVDDETGRHCARVELLTYQFCRALGFEERRSRLLAAGARMHDLGKVGVPHRVLLAPRKLTPMEYEIAKKHVEIGVDLLSFSDHEVVKVAKIIAQSHHERWDGSGYPKRLFEDQIPIEGRITTIVDVFDVLTHKRVYKRAWSVEQARDEIEFLAGKAFDPNLVEIFLTQVVKADYVIPTEFPNEPKLLIDL
jgi:response regulator RpfG family c-di-GMP phosphodiesterase